MGTAVHDRRREWRDIDRHVVSVSLGLAQHAAEQLQEKKVHTDHLPPSVVTENSVSAHPLVDYEAAVADLVGHMFPGPIMRLSARTIALVADTDGRLENLYVEAFDRFVSPLQVVKIEWPVLRRRAENGGEIAALRLMLAGIRLVAVANPA